ncbi:MAG: hypothetical protein A2008_06000 [Candidatus Wallbacteria bacterium GWC2_49_35]|uniref:IspG C-terminal domain-containing protein n=1 Tax=Candidatus Wallbacteria bacterium GWC2_49_35 TaxID=1817813 RepID=A0A1F7WG43_9BACT|nr:MAG: hypothetical protein A2008_06000 [Candidatus Wallbacteria bacterium GWC2_49_35]HBC76936.1 hypothetical protein [Candidatus Wallbacteria bacterium]
MNRTANVELDFSSVELSADWRDRTKFFSSFVHFAPLFTYQLNYSSGGAFNTLKKLNIKKYNLVFDSPEEFLKTDNRYLSDRKTSPGALCVKNTAGAGGRKLSDLCAELIDKAAGAFEASPPPVRLYIDCGRDGPASNTADELNDFLDKVTASGLFDPCKLSFCFQAGNVLDIIELNKKIVMKYPGLSRSLHIEPSKDLNKVENAILFYLKFSDAGLKHCSIAPRFASDEAGAGGYLEALEILRSLEFNNIPGVFFISCPTCTRCKIDVITLAKNIYERVRYIEKPLKIAVMGCEVNGPGEASHADIGVAGSPGNAVIFEHGRIVERVTPDKIEEKFMERIAGYVK